ncbi:ABC transporter substrate-binding protein, partial [Mesorhizobium sp. M3A.F.Ca.ET.174.01.1.1]
MALTATKALAALTTAFALTVAAVSSPVLAAAKKVTISQAFQSM